MPEDPLPFKIFLTPDNAAALQKEFTNHIAVEEVDETGLCKVHLRIDTSADALSIFHAGYNAMYEYRKNSQSSF